MAAQKSAMPLRVAGCEWEGARESQGADLPFASRVIEFLWGEGFMAKAFDSNFCDRVVR